MKNLKLTLVAILIASISFGQNLDSIQQKVNNYISQAKLDSAKTYIHSNIDKLDLRKDKNELNYQLVKVLFIQSSYDEALQQAFNSLDHVDDQEQRVKFNFMIGAIYSAISDYSKSVDYFKLVVQESENASLTVKSHLLLSDLHFTLKDTLNGKKSLSDAYRITSASKLDSKINDHVAMQYNYYSENYELCKQLNFKTIKDSTSFISSKSFAYSMIGDCLIKQDSLLKSTSFYDEHLKLTFETKDPEQIKDAANKLIDVYEKLGNQEKANSYHKIYNEADNDSSSFSIEKYRDLYTIEKNRELKEIKAKNSRKYLVFGLVLCFLVGFSIYYFVKLKKKNRELFDSFKRTPGKKIVINNTEILKIENAIQALKNEQLFLKSNITKKSFCSESDIKSERYLSQYINDKYKKSFSVFINDLRIDYAYNRIQTDKKFRNYKIEEIAKSCGFGSKKSFERAFVANYNQTPYKFISGLTS